jgi:hypothetical protein
MPRLRQKGESLERKVPAGSVKVAENRAQIGEKAIEVRPRQKHLSRGPMKGHPARRISRELSHERSPRLHHLRHMQSDHPAQWVIPCPRYFQKT